MRKMKNFGQFQLICSVFSTTWHCLGEACFKHLLKNETTQRTCGSAYCVFVVMLAFGLKTLAAIADVILTGHGFLVIHAMLWALVSSKYCNRAFCRRCCGQELGILLSSKYSAISSRRCTMIIHPFCCCSTYWACDGSFIIPSTLELPLQLGVLLCRGLAIKKLT